jgi:Ca2+-transporting ATPase
MIIDQFKEPMVLILLAAAALSMIIGALGDGSECVDGGIIFINGVISIVQERKASSALEALEKISAPKAKVLRDGKLTTIDAKDLVPGDVVYIEDGCIVPADLRLFKTSNLKIQEASLTGESEAVEKDGNAQLKDDAVLGDRINIAYNSTIVTYGNGYGVVIASGMRTEIGRIAGLLSKQEEPTSPLKRQLSVFIK